MARTGRPSVYKSEFAEQARKLCLLGATDIELADFFAVGLRTIARWQSVHEEFRQALKRGKDGADERVERSLYARATGYSHEAVKIFMPAGAKAPVYAPYIEHVPPDTTAMIFWLKNRRPAEWRDQQIIRHEVANQLSDDELERIAAGSRKGTSAAPVDSPKPH